MRMHVCSMRVGLLPTERHAGTKDDVLLRSRWVFGWMDKPCEYTASLLSAMFQGRGGAWCE